MPKIEIIEKDETTAGLYDADTDVVYIPGLVDTNQKCLKSEEGKYVGIEANVPTLFTNVRSFESLCGTRGVTFEEDQYYYELASTTSDGFDSYSTPYHRTMFKKGSIDPSYVMAKELLASGLSVVYERINKDSDNYIETKETPTAENFSKFYKDDTDYIKITSHVAPKWYEKVELGELVEDTIVATEIHKEYKLNKKLKFPFDVNVMADESKLENMTVKFYESNSTIPLDSLQISENVEFGFLVTIDVAKGNEDLFNGFEIEDVIYIVDVSEKSKHLFVANLTADGNIENFTEVKRIDPKGDETADDVGAYFKDEVYSYNGEDYYELKGSTHTSIVMDDNGLMLPTPKNWSRDFVNYYEESTKKVELKSVTDTGANGKLYIKEDSLSISGIYSELQSVFSIDGKLVDKGFTPIKYLTSGGYPTFGYDGNSIASKMIALAEERGDCVAIIDHSNNPDRESNIDRTGNVYKVISDVSCQDLQSEFATMFTPWFEFNRITVDRDDEDKVLKSTEDNPLYGLTSIELPGSYAYLVTLADSIKTNANWLAIAGSARGVVQNIAQDGARNEITNGAADGMQPRNAVSINAITNIKPYGYTIWGNRTLKNNGIAGNLTATSFLNIRNLVSDVKKQAYTVSRQLTFEQNNDVLWANFKSLISSLLDRMLTGYGISGYKIERDTAHEKYDKKATLCAKIILYPVYAVEDFYITVVLKDDKVSVE